MTVHLNLGSNLGNRMELIGRATALLARSLPAGKIYLSDYVESEPDGFTSPNLFLNRGLMYVTEAETSPLDLLDITQRVEREIGNGAPHRNDDGTYCDRPIDIDIIDIDGISFSSPRLTLPHPRARLRPFVWGPMRQLSNLCVPQARVGSEGDV